MMIESVQRGCARDAVPHFEVIKKLIEDDIKGTMHEEENIKVGKIRSGQDKRYAKRTRRLVRNHLSRRRSRRLNLDETFRAPSLFTWRY